MKPDLSVIILSFNTRQLLDDCLTSLFKNTASLKLEVFVVDNASKDDSFNPGSTVTHNDQINLICLSVF